MSDSGDAMIDDRKWLPKTLDAISQFLNCFLFNGDPNECISGRCWREQRMIYKNIDWLFWLLCGESNHCRNAYQKDNSWAGHRLRRIKQYNTIHRS